FDKFGLNIKELALPMILIYTIVIFGSIGGGWFSGYLIKSGISINRARKSTMLISAISILPVVFVTLLPTSFEVNDGLYKSLAASTIKVSKIEIVDGSKTTIREDMAFPPEIIETMKQLDGKTYNSARDLSIDMEALIGKENLKKYEPLIHTNSRANQLYWMAILLIGLAASGHAAWMANVYAMASDVFPKKAVASVAGIGGMIGAAAGMLADFGVGQVLTNSGTAGYFFAFLVASLLYLVLLGIIHLLMPNLNPLGDDLKPLN
ncbi:hypothetical protein ACFLSP_04595, partial [Bacteroidota bacterium]